MRALYDRVIVETVGVGQSETDVAGLADSILFCVQPGSGDSLQFMKAGIMEIPHVAAVTKADSGAQARRALKDLRGALSLAEAEEGIWRVRRWWRGTGRSGSCSRSAQRVVAAAGPSGSKAAKAGR